MAGLPTTSNIEYYFGDSFDGISIIWNDSNGNPQDLTDYLASMKIKTSEGGEILHLDSDTQGGLTIPDPLNGTIIISVAPSVMRAAGFVSGTIYNYDLQAKNAAGTIIKTLAKGTFKVLGEITDVV